MKKLFKLLFTAIGLLAFSSPTLAQEGSGTADNVIDEDGYYYVYTVSGTDQRGMTVFNGRGGWDPLERENPAFIFKIEKATDENTYYLYNLKEDSWYWEIPAYYFAEFKQGIENRAALIFDPQNDEKTSFKIRPVKMRGDYSDETQYAKNGNFNTEGTRDLPNYTAIYHPLGQWTGSVWQVEKVSSAVVKKAQMLVALRKAVQVYSENTLFTINSNPLITDVPSNCDPSTGQPGQFFSTCQRTDDTSSSFAKLIDGSIENTSRFQSTWDATAAPKPQFMQVDVSADDEDDKQVAGVQLQIGLRPNGWGSAEFPTDITVYATNDASIAEDMDLTTIEQVADLSDWKKIGDYDLSTSQVLTRINGNWGQQRSAMFTATAAVTNRWETKNIVFPDKQKYRFIRFYINNTAVNASDNHDFTISEFQLHELEGITATASQAEAINTLQELIVSDNAKVKAGTVTDEDLTAIETAMQAVTNSKSEALTQLQAVVDSVNALKISFIVSKDPGYNDSTAVADYNAALSAAVAGTHAGHSDAEYASLAADLRKALETAKTSINPVVDGYYSLVSAYPDFYAPVAITGLPARNLIGWQMYHENDPKQIYKISTVGEGQFSIQNIVTGKYFDKGKGSDFTESDVQKIPQSFKPISGYPGQFNILNAYSTWPYHANYHQSGANVKRYLCLYPGGGNSPSAWRLVPVSGAKLDSLLAVAPQENLKSIAAQAIDTARSVYDKTFNYKQSKFLITNCDDNDPDNCQWWSTCQEPDAVRDGYSSYANLIDGKLNTCFQSTWWNRNHEYPQWMQADLKDNPVKDFTLYYGLRDGAWGAWEQWTQITIFATNDETIAKDESIDTYDQVSATDGWKKIGVFDLPDEQAVRNYSGSNRTFNYDINNVMDQKYRFIRFYATHCYKPCPSIAIDLGEFSIGELNIMENTYDENTAPYFYSEGLKDAADRLKAQENTLREAIAAGTVTQQQIDRLNELRSLVVSLTPVKNNLQSLYTADTTYVNKFGASEAYGDVTDAEWDAIQTALTNAKAVLDSEHASKGQIEAQETALTEAFANFKAAQKQFEPNKWYYIASRCATRPGSVQVNGEGSTAGIPHENSIYYTFCYGNVAYAAAENSMDVVGNWGPNNENAVYWGYYVAGQEKGGAGGSELYTDILDPHTMWRLVPVEGKEGQYAIQNRANGLYMSGYNQASWISLRKNPDPYQFELVGSGQYRFRSAGASVYMQYAGDGHMQSFGDNPSANDRNAVALEPVETTDGIVMEYPADSIFIKSLPYAVSSDVLEQNKDIADIYGVKGLEVVGGDSTLLLEKKTAIQAGEPFIVVSKTTPSTLILPANDSFSFEEKTVNGLTATLDYTSAPKTGLGYFANNVLRATGQGTFIEGHAGYFDVRTMPLFTTTTEADLRYPLNGSGVDAIKSIIGGKDDAVNVYSIDGKLLKRNVNRSKAGKGLDKGIYIIGKKKISVK